MRCTPSALLLSLALAGCCEVTRPMTPEDALPDLVTRLERRCVGLQALVDELAAERDDLTRQLASVREALRRVGLSEPPADERDGLGLRTPWVPVPLIEAEVLSTRVDGAVTLSVGADDGVLVGMQFSVYRGSRFVAKVVAEEVAGTRTRCRVLFTGDGQSVRPWDAAATRLQ